MKTGVQRLKRSPRKNVKLCNFLYDENFIQSCDNNENRAIKGAGIDLNLGSETPKPTSVIRPKSYATEASQMSA